jgi:hypothetical protein
MVAMAEEASRTHSTVPYSTVPELQVQQAGLDLESTTVLRTELMDSSKCESSASRRRDWLLPPVINSNKTAYLHVNVPY